MQHRSYEEIENDTSLSEEERNFLLVDKMFNEDSQNVVSSSDSLSEEELEKMMMEDLAHMQELEKTNK